MATLLVNQRDGTSSLLTEIRLSIFSQFRRYLCKHSFSPPGYHGFVDKDEQDVKNEIKELTKRISELEGMLASLLKPLTDARKTTERYLKLAGLLLDHGGLTPEVILPDLKDPISKDIVRVLLERPEQNISQITDLVKSRRGSASRRIIRTKLLDLEQQHIIQKQQQGSRAIYTLTPEVIKKWTQLLGLTI
jgi:DNA-binding transcriptional ArsR family regulator